MKRAPLVSMFGLMLSLAARASDPVAQMTFRVTDDFGNVVMGVPVDASTFSRWVPGSEFGRDEHDHARGVTDTNGLVALKLASKTGNVRYSVFAEGMCFDSMNKMKIGDTAYYRDMGGTLRYTNSIGGQWQPWDPTVDIQIKKVLNPIPLYAKNIEFDGDKKIPVQGTPIGYDLLRGDWVMPHGEGVVADLVFVLHQESEREVMHRWGDRPRPYILYDVTLSVEFPNDGDGLHSVYVPPREGSVLRLPREAPSSGYITNLVKHVYSQEEAPPHTDKREDQNYFFRVRTEKDDRGNVVSALYGKISGDIEVAPGGQVRFTFYLNPTPNDRNLEFDPKQNLFTNLSPQEAVSDP